MADFIYSILVKIGFNHPLHPTITHLPVGLVIAAFVFSLIALLFRKPAFAQTARHCSILALISVFPTLLLGIMDWQHFYAGAWLFPVKMKFFLAGLVLILLFVTVSVAASTKEGSMKTVLLYGLCLITVVGLGYFGGELVYGQKVPSGKPDDSLSRQGAVLFSDSCSACHYADKTESRIGPGLKGIFQQDKLPTSGWSTTEANVRKQLKTPYKNMPPFANLPEEKVKALIAYLKTL